MEDAWDARIHGGGPADRARLRGLLRTPGRREWIVGGSRRAGLAFVFADERPGHERVIRKLSQAGWTVALLDGCGLADGALRGALRAGARALLPWPASAATVRACVNLLGCGVAVLPVRLLAHLLQPPGAAGFSLNGRSGFTECERRVLDGLLAGRSNKEIAAALRVTAATVESHLTQLYRKLGVRSRMEALLKCLPGAFGR